MTGTYDVPALQRAQAVLEAVAASPVPVRAAQLAATTGIPRSTVYLLLESLARRRWVERRGEGYVIGLALFDLGSGYLRQDGLLDAFRPAAAAFVQRHHEAVRMAMLDGNEVIYLAREDARGAARLVSDVGSRRPAHCTALGKALLASFSDRQARELLPPVLPRLTPRTVTDVDAVIGSLQQIRQDGFACDSEEVSKGLCCFGAYVGRTRSGRRIAVSTSTPADRLDARRSRELGMAISRLARQIAVGVA